MSSSKTLKAQTHDVVSVDLEMARSVFAAGDYEEVLAFTDVAISRAADQAERFALLLVRASAFGERREYDYAVTTLETAGEFIDQASPMSKARFYCQRAYLRVKSDRADEALIDYEAARYWAKKSGDRITEATARNNIAKQYSNARRLEEALHESDIAIKLGVEIGSDWRLGRYYDQRAQILVDHNRFVEALLCSEKAIALLSDNPSLSEARQTRERGMIGLFLQHFDHPDPVESFSSRRSVLQKIPHDLDKATVQAALERSNGHVSNAAVLLKITHGALLKAIKRHGLQHLQQRKHDRRVYRSIISK